MDTETKTLRLALAACQYPAGVFDRTPHDDGRTGMRRLGPGPADASFARLAQRAQREPFDALVWCGDRIYVDATAGLFDPQAGGRDVAHSLEANLRRSHREFNRMVQRWWSGAHAPALVDAIDDHEIDDNWEPSADPVRKAALVEMREAGKKAFVAFKDEPAQKSAQLWRATTVAGHPLFVADLRTERSVRNPAAIEDARIMSYAQWRTLTAWMDETKQERHRFIVGSSMLLPRRITTSQGVVAAALRSDAWDGYPSCLHGLLAHIAQHDIRGCVFLSGNEHIPCFARITVRHSGEAPSRAVELWSIQTGAMYAPYPFANSCSADFSDETEFAFSHGGQRYVCTVETEFPPPGDGFTVVELRGGRLLRSFDAAPDPQGAAPACVA